MKITGGALPGSQLSVAVTTGAEGAPVTHDKVIFCGNGVLNMGATLSTIVTVRVIVD